MTDYERLIDDAAREITQAPSPVDLRARVIEEIRAGGTSLQARQSHQDEAKASYHSSRWWLAAAAVIILAVYVGWPKPQPIDLPTPPPLARKQMHDGPRPIAGSFAVARPATAAPARGVTAPRVPEAEIASLPALETPAAIAIAPLAADPTPVPALDVAAPLDIETLDIKPLTSPPAATGGQ